MDFSNINDPDDFDAFLNGPPVAAPPSDDEVVIEEESDELGAGGYAVGLSVEEIIRRSIKLTPAEKFLDAVVGLLASADDAPKAQLKTPVVFESNNSAPLFELIYKWAVEAFPLAASVPVSTSASAGASSSSSLATEPSDAQVSALAQHAQPLCAFLLSGQRLITDVLARNVDVAWTARLYSYAGEHDEAESSDASSAAAGAGAGLQRRDYTASALAVLQVLSCPLIQDTVRLIWRSAYNIHDIVEGRNESLCYNWGTKGDAKVWSEENKALVAAEREEARARNGEDDGADKKAVSKAKAKIAQARRDRGQDSVETQEAEQIARNRIGIRGLLKTVSTLGSPQGVPDRAGAASFIEGLLLPAIQQYRVGPFDPMPEPGNYTELEHEDEQEGQSASSGKVAAKVKQAASTPSSSASAPASSSKARGGRGRRGPAAAADSDSEEATSSSSAAAATPTMRRKSKKPESDSAADGDENNDGCTNATPLHSLAAMLSHPGLVRRIVSWAKQLPRPSYSSSSAAASSSSSSSVPSAAITGLACLLYGGSLDLITPAAEEGINERLFYRAMQLFCSHLQSPGAAIARYCGMHLTEMRWRSVSGSLSGETLVHGNDTLLRLMRWPVRAILRDMWPLLGIPGDGDDSSAAAAASASSSGAASSSSSSSSSPRSASAAAAAADSWFTSPWPDAVFLSTAAERVTDLLSAVDEWFKMETPPDTSAAGMGRLVSSLEVAAQRLYIAKPPEANPPWPTVLVEHDEAIAILKLLQERNTQLLDIVSQDFARPPSQRRWAVLRYFPYKSNNAMFLLVSPGTLAEANRPESAGRLVPEQPLADKELRHMVARSLRRYNPGWVASAAVPVSALSNAAAAGSAGRSAGADAKTEAAKGRQDDEEEVRDVSEDSADDVSPTASSTGGSKGNSSSSAGGSLQYDWPIVPGKKNGHYLEISAQPPPFRKLIRSWVASKPTSKKEVDDKEDLHTARLLACYAALLPQYRGGLQSSLYELQQLAGLEPKKSRMEMKQEEERMASEAAEAAAAAAAARRAEAAAEEAAEAGLESRARDDPSLLLESVGQAWGAEEDADMLTRYKLRHDKEGATERVIAAAMAARSTAVSAEDAVILREKQAKKGKAAAASSAAAAAPCPHLQSGSIILVNSTLNYHRPLFGRVLAIYPHTAASNKSKASPLSITYLDHTGFPRPLDDTHTIRVATAPSPPPSYSPEQAAEFRRRVQLRLATFGLEALPNAGGLRDLRPSPLPAQAAAGATSSPSSSSSSAAAAAAPAPKGKGAAGKSGKAKSAASSASGSAGSADSSSGSSSATILDDEGGENDVLSVQWDLSAASAALAPLLDDGSDVSTNGIGSDVTSPPPRLLCWSPTISYDDIQRGEAQARGAVALTTCSTAELADLEEDGRPGASMHGFITRPAASLTHGGWLKRQAFLELLAVNAWYFRLVMDVVARLWRTHGRLILILTGGRNRPLEHARLLSRVIAAGGLDGEPKDGPSSKAKALAVIAAEMKDPDFYQRFIGGLNLNPHDWETTAGEARAHTSYSRGRALMLAAQAADAAAASSTSSSSSSSSSSAASGGEFKAAGKRKRGGSAASDDDVVLVLDEDAAGSSADGSVAASEAAPAAASASASADPSSAAAAPVPLQPLPVPASASKQSSMRRVTGRGRKRTLSEASGVSDSESLVSVGASSASAATPALPRLAASTAPAAVAASAGRKRGRSASQMSVAEPAPAAAALNDTAPVGNSSSSSHSAANDVTMTISPATPATTPASQPAPSASLSAADAAAHAAVGATSSSAPLASSAGPAPLPPLSSLPSPVSSVSSSRASSRQPSRQSSAKKARKAPGGAARRGGSSSLAPLIEDSAAEELEGKEDYVVLVPPAAVPVDATHVTVAAPASAPAPVPSSSSSSSSFSSSAAAAAAAEVPTVTSAAGGSADAASATASALPDTQACIIDLQTDDEDEESGPSSAASAAATVVSPSSSRAGGAAAGADRRRGGRQRGGKAATTGSALSSSASASQPASAASSVSASSGSGRRTGFSRSQTAAHAASAIVESSDEDSDSGKDGEGATNAGASATNSESRGGDPSVSAAAGSQGQNQKSKKQQRRQMQTAKKAAAFVESTAGTEPASRPASAAVVQAQSPDNAELSDISDGEAVGGVAPKGASSSSSASSSLRTAPQQQRPPPPPASAPVSATSQMSGSGFAAFEVAITADAGSGDAPASAPTAAPSSSSLSSSSLSSAPAAAPAASAGASTREGSEAEEAVQEVDGDDNDDDDENMGSSCSSSSAAASSAALPRGGRGGKRGGGGGRSESINAAAAAAASASDASSSSSRRSTRYQQNDAKQQELQDLLLLVDDVGLAKLFKDGSAGLDGRAVELKFVSYASSQECVHHIGNNMKTTDLEVLCEKLKEFTVGKHQSAAPVKEAIARWQFVIDKADDDAARAAAGPTSGRKRKISPSSSSSSPCGNAASSSAPAPDGAVGSSSAASSVNGDSTEAAAAGSSKKRQRRNKTDSDSVSDAPAAPAATASAPPKAKGKRGRPKKAGGAASSSSSSAAASAAGHVGDHADDAINIDLQHEASGDDEGAAGAAGFKSRR